MTVVHVAPATKVFTVAHIAAGFVGEAGAGGGLTVCAVVMEPAELWVPIALRPGDKVCQGCARPGTPQPAQETLI